MRPVIFVTISLCVLAHRSLAMPRDCNPERDCVDAPTSCLGDVKPEIPLGGCCPVCPQSPDCAAVSCLKPQCEEGVEPKIPDGKCCPECPNSLDCRAVRCAFPTCEEGVKPKIPAGKCCPECPDPCADVRCLTCTPRSDWQEGDCCPICLDECANVLCALPICKEGVEPKIPDGKCCPECPPDPCADVPCKLLTCPGMYKPKGECCPICPDCSNVRCAQAISSECPGGASSYVPPGECCAQCPGPDCSMVDCPQKELECPGGFLSYVPEGECCAQCPVVKPGTCPELESGTFGICLQQCSSDEDCEEETKCCSNGCGNLCTAPVFLNCTYKGVTYTHGDSFQDDCNTCFCKDGVVGCTKKLCPTGCTYDGKVYQPGESYPQACNMCTCQEGGFSLCTLRACTDGCLVDGTWYEDGESYDDLCNTCTCDRGSVACTEKACAGCTYNGQYYEPGETYQQDCNTCICQEGGLSRCTKRGCSDGCLVDGTWYDDGADVPGECYTCVCKAGSVQCPDVECGCEVNGVRYNEGDQVPCKSLRDERCGSCYCRGGNVVYQPDRPCPRPACRNPKTAPGRCCPWCPRDFLQRLLKHRGGE